VDRFIVMRLFVRIVERRSFSAAAADLSLPRSGATAAIKQMEERLGTQLLQRSTRHVSPTPEGEVYYRRCMAILTDIEDAERDLAGGSLTGTVRLDINGHMAREFILPELPAFLDLHPGLAVHIGESDRLVDLLREGIDCVIRAGEPVDHEMTGRRLGIAHEITCASPGYLEKHGVPVSPDELRSHLMVGFVSSRTGRSTPLEFVVDGEIKNVILPARILVGNSDTAIDAARLGLGLTQAPRHRFLPDLAAGALVEVLADFPPTPTSISLLYPTNRQLAPRIRVLIDWLVDTLGPQLHPM
jgi:DNA-binding transcriptional LysR family regulator